jgi:hypothetical protein
MHKIKMVNQFVIRAVAVAAAIMLMSGVASAQNKFGSIYFSQNDGARGWSTDYNSQNGAEDRAYNECVGAGGRDCVRATWFRNACGALAVGDGNGWGSHWAETRIRAEGNALRTCRQNARNCEVVESVCTSNVR